MRLPGWEKALANYIEEVRHTPFKRGEHDCFIFAVKCEEAISGVTRFPELYQAKYHNLFGANKAFIKNGYRGMLNCIDSRCIEIDVNFMQRGDWVAIDSHEGLAIGVCVGNKIAGVGEDGLVFLDNSKAKAAWSI